MRQQLLQWASTGPAPILQRLSLESCLSEAHKATTTLPIRKVEDKGLGQGQAGLSHVALLEQVLNGSVFFLAAMLKARGRSA